MFHHHLICGIYINYPPSHMLPSFQQVLLQPPLRYSPTFQLIAYPPSHLCPTIPNGHRVPTLSPTPHPLRYSPTFQLISYPPSHLHPNLPTSPRASRGQVWCGPTVGQGRLLLEDKSELRESSNHATSVGTLVRKLLFKWNLTYTPPSQLVPSYSPSHINPTLPNSSLIPNPTSASHLHPTLQTRPQGSTKVTTSWQHRFQDPKFPAKMRDFETNLNSFF